MKTSQGPAHSLEALLADTTASAHSMLQKLPSYPHIPAPSELAEKLAISALIVQELSHKRHDIYNFNIENALSLTDGAKTGPSLLVSYARLCSIIKVANLTAEKIGKANFATLKQRKATSLLWKMAIYPDIVVESYVAQQTYVLVDYLLQFSALLTSSYKALGVIEKESGTRVADVAGAVCWRLRGRFWRME